MPTARISGLGRVGLVSDPPAWAAPPNAISDGQNVRAFHGRLTNFPGYVTYATPPIEPHGVFGFQSTLTTDLLWVEAGLAKVYVYNGSTHSNITRQTTGTDVDYTMNEAFHRWTGGIQGSLGFLNNGADAPQQWDAINTTTRLKDMSYDPQAAPGSQTWGELNYRCFAMRPYRGTIIAMNLTRGSTALPSTLQWCQFFAPGETALDWVPRTTNSAREYTLGDTQGAIIDGAELRDDFIIYKEDAVYRMTFTGDPNAPFRFTRLPEFARIVNRNCIGIARELHVIAAPSDIYAFDGNVFRSILDKRRRERYTTVLSATRGFNTFVAVLNQEKEVWICYSPVGSQYPSEAIVWNYQNDTLSDTKLPEVKAMDAGQLGAPPVDNFDDPPDISFDSDVDPFDGQPFAPPAEYLVGAFGSNLSVFGNDVTDNGTPRLCQAERTGLVPQDPIAGIESIERAYRFSALRPYLTSTGPVEISLGAQMSQTGPVAWQPFKTLDPSRDYHAHFRASGRFWAWRIRTLANVQWELTDVEVDYKVVRRK